MPFPQLPDEVMRQLVGYVAFYELSRVAATSQAMLSVARAVQRARGNDGVAYIGSCDKHLHAIVLANGARRWRFALAASSPAAGASSPRRFGAVGAVATHCGLISDGEVARLRAAEGAEGGLAGCWPA